MVTKVCIQKAMRTLILNPDATKATYNFSNRGGLTNIIPISGSSLQHFPLSVTIQNSFNFCYFNLSSKYGLNLTIAKYSGWIFIDFQGLQVKKSVCISVGHTGSSSFPTLRQETFH